MIRDCRANRAEGWRYFVSNYVPVIRKLVAHYSAFQAGAADAGVSDSGVVERVLAGVRDPQSSLFQSLEPAPERWFVAELRQKTLAEIVFPPPDHELELEAAAAALAPLTVVEKQAAWTEGMGYTAEQGGAMLRMAPATVAKIRDRAAELLRGQVDTWRRSILRENGPQLGLAASQARGEDCLSAKVFLDVLDGCASWRNREDMERHVTQLSALRRSFLPDGRSDRVAPRRASALGRRGGALLQADGSRTGEKEGLAPAHPGVTDPAWQSRCCPRRCTTGRPRRQDRTVMPADPAWYRIELTG